MKELLPDLQTSAQESPAQPWHMPRLPQFRIPRFELHSHMCSERAAVESYIQQRFAQVHGAQLSHFLPNILSLRCGSDYSAAVGLAPAANGKLFAEQYLSAPIEEVISHHLGLQVARTQIVEIGNLVSTWKGSSLLLFIVIGELLERLGCDYVLFTGTREVKALLARLHYSPIVVAQANPSLLPDAGANWGSYYSNQPQVMFGDNRPALLAARKNPMYRTTVAAINHAIEKLRTQFLRANPAGSIAGGGTDE